MKRGFFSMGEIVMGGHFPVSVISKNREDVDKLLAPYQENNRRTCPKEYLAFINAESEYEKEEISREYTSFYDFASDKGYAYDEVQNAYGSWGNPNAKWDWYTIGGMFNKMLLLKDGSRASYCRIGEIDMRKSEETREKAMCKWSDIITHKGVQGAMVRERYLTCYGDGENYADKNSHFSTGVLVTPDGIWHEVGTNGNISEKSSFAELENYYNHFIKTIQDTDADYWITVVDCHM